MMQAKKGVFILFFYSILALQVQGQDKTLVQYFMHTSCPISQKYTLTINAIADKYKNELVEFELIFLDIQTKADKQEVEKFIHRYQLKLPYTIYSSTNYALNKGVKVTPEVVVTQSNQIQYQGAIDDWFIDWGKNKKQAEQHYLEQALDSLLMHQPVWIKKTNAIGCLIELNNKTN